MTASEPMDPRINLEGPDDRDAEENELFKPGYEWSLTCYQPDLSELVGSYGNTLETQRYIETHLPADVRERLSWDSEGGMLAASGNEADIRTLAATMQAIRRP